MSVPDLLLFINHSRSNNFGLEQQSYDFNAISDSYVYILICAETDLGIPQLPHHIDSAKADGRGPKSHTDNRTLHRSQQTVSRETKICKNICYKNENRRNLKDMGDQQGNVKI